MTIHAVDKNIYIESIVIGYKNRPENSVSKLNTYSDGIKVLKTIIKLYKTYKPMGFFGIITLILVLLAAFFFIPVLLEYIKTDMVPDFPTLIVCGFTMLAAIQSFLRGWYYRLYYKRTGRILKCTCIRQQKIKKI